MAQQSNVPAIEWLNPLRHVDADTYAAFWCHLYDTFLHGFWARFFFFVFLFLAFWTGVRNRNPTLAAVCLLLAAIIAYSGGLIDWVKTVRV
jgi:hypothetical protein